MTDHCPLCFEIHDTRDLTPACCDVRELWKELVKARAESLELRERAEAAEKDAAKLRAELSLDPFVTGF